MGQLPVCEIGTCGSAEKCSSMGRTNKQAHRPYFRCACCFFFSRRTKSGMPFHKSGEHSHKSGKASHFW